MFLTFWIVIIVYLTVNFDGSNCSLPETFRNDTGPSDLSGRPSLNNKYDPNKTYKVVCYYASWASKRHKEPHIELKNLDPSLCTHMIYAHARIDILGRVQSLDINNDLPEYLGGYSILNGLREKNPSLKTLIGIGGSRGRSKIFSALSADPLKRETFINTTKEFLKKYKFDGVNLDWVSRPNKSHLFYFPN